MSDLDTRCEAKIVRIREGSANRTVEELNEMFVQDACDLLDVNPQVEQYNPEDRSAALEAAVSDYERNLSQNGYLTLWNDGYVIYHNLDTEEWEYLANA